MDPQYLWPRAVRLYLRASEKQALVAHISLGPMPTKMSSLKKAPTWKFHCSSELNVYSLFGAVTLSCACCRKIKCRAAICGSICIKKSKVKSKKKPNLRNWQKQKGSSPEFFPPGSFFSPWFECFLWVILFFYRICRIFGRDSVLPNLFYFLSLKSACYSPYL